MFMVYRDKYNYKLRKFFLGCLYYVLYKIIVIKGIIGRKDFIIFLICNVIV